VRIEDLQLAMVNRILPEMGRIINVIEMLEVGKSGVFVSMADVCVKSPRTGLL
jgi:DNA-directed RNA polymerase subunit E'/Rpb7